MKYGWILAVLPAGIALLLLARQKAKKQEALRELRAKEELLTNIKQFAGCFHSLSQAVQTKNASRAQRHLDKWKQKAAGLENLEHWLDSLSGQKEDPLTEAASLMETWKRWGICSDSPGDLFQITQEHEVLYLFDDVYNIGDQARVDRPAWWVRNGERLICIETGVAEIEYQE